MQASSEPTDFPDTVPTSDAKRAATEAAHGDGIDCSQEQRSLKSPTHSTLNEEDASDRKRPLTDFPDSKRRKFILIDDVQRGTRVRVRVMLDNVRMSDMPDSHLRVNSVYPRSYYPRHMCSLPGSPEDGLDKWSEDASSDEGEDGRYKTVGKWSVGVPVLEGSVLRLRVPRTTKVRRARECALNEVGYRMSWSQAKTFNGRTLFMQRSRESSPILKKPACRRSL